MAADIPPASNLLFIAPNFVLPGKDSYRQIMHNLPTEAGDRSSDSGAELLGHFSKQARGQSSRALNIKANLP